MMGDGGTGRILVIDDDHDVQRAVKRSAERAGYEVLQAFDGPPALAIAETEPLDLILLDISMPLMDGRDVLARLKKTAGTVAIPVIIYSARDDQYDRQVAFELGADDFLDKPFNVTLLIRRITQLISSARDSAKDRTTR